MRLFGRGCIRYNSVRISTLVNGDANAAKYIAIVGNFVWQIIVRYFPHCNDIIHRAWIVKSILNKPKCMAWNDRLKT